MRVTTYGTRGSVPVAGDSHTKYGGNTSCLNIESKCLPDDRLLIVDAGTGIVPLGRKALAVGVMEAYLLFTHYHHDHTQGLLLCPPTFKDDFRFRCFGPVEHDIGPAEMLGSIMRSPFHPLQFAEVKHHFTCKQIPYPRAQVLVVHPKGGIRLLEVDELVAAEEKSPAQVGIRGGAFPIDECMVIRMIRTHHPEKAISYRFEERPTGKVFVFLTDHENTAGISQEMRKHVLGADLLIMDCQYPREVYNRLTVGFGHSSPDYCVSVALEGGVTQLGLTHHDPGSDDSAIDKILVEAQGAAEQLGFRGEITALADYQQLKV